MATVELELLADFSKASKSLNKFSQEANSSLSAMKTAFGALAAVAGTALAAFSVKKITEAAIQQEQAIRSMNSALALTGEYSEKASKDMIEFADQLQKNSMYSDDAALSLVGLTKSMGATNEQTKEIIQAAADLSAVTGDSLDASVEKLGKTLSGTAGRLSQTESGLKGLTEQQLKAGVGIDIIAAKYRGMAQQMTQTFGGAVQQTENSFEDLLKAMGSLITQNPVVIKAVKLVGEVFNELTDYIKENKKAIIDFSIDAVGNAVKIFAFLVDEVGSTVAIFKNFGAVIDLIIMSLGEFALAAIDTSDTIIKAFKSIINLALNPVLTGIKALAQGLKFMGAISEEQLAKFEDGLSSIAMDSSTSGLESMRKDVEDFTNAAREGFLESSENLLKTKDSFTETAQKIDGFADSIIAMKDATDDSNKSLKKLSDTNKDLKNNIAFKDKTFLGGLITGQNIIDAGYATAGAVTKGAAGANQLFSSGVGAASNVFLPGSGEAASAIAGLLAQGPEATKAAVQGFIDQIPVIMDAVAESLPVIVQTLAENADEIIIALVKGTPKIAAAMAIEVPIALAKALPGALTSLLQEFLGAVGEAFNELFNGIKKGFGDIFVAIGKIPAQLFDSIKNSVGTFFTSLLSSLGDILKQFFTEFPKQLGTAIVDAIKSAIGSIGGGLGGGVGGILNTAKDFVITTVTGGLNKVVKKFGFAGGGEIPSGYPNDTFPMPFAQSGENVIDRSTNEKLNLFLDGANRPTKIVLQIGERELAEVILNLNRQGYRTA